MRSHPLDRRAFLAAGAAALIATQAQAASFFGRKKRSIGLQLFTLGTEATRDLDASLAAVAAIGYREVEIAGFMGRTPKELRMAFDRAGLVCRSAHVQARGAAGFEGDLGRLGDDLRTIGVKCAVMPSPFMPDRLEQRPSNEEGVRDWYRRVLPQLTADDWKMNADFLNQKARVLKEAEIVTGYHNHNYEFAPRAGGRGMDILLSETDRDLVTFEADVGWMAAAGIDPLTFIQAHRGRFSLMHLKDIKASTPTNFEMRMDPTEVGSGRIDWRRLLPAAHAAGVRGFYVEQGAPFERSRLEAAKISYDFLAGLRV